MQITLKVEKPTAQKCFEKNFQNIELNWKDVYIYIYLTYNPGQNIWNN